MKVDVKNINRIRLAVLEHRGDPKLVGESVNKLVSWAKAQSVNLKPKPGEAFGIGYDDPKITPPNEFRFDLAIKVPDNLKLEGNIIEKHIPAGRYAIAMHKGSRHNLDETIYPIYRQWLPKSGEELGDFPCIFCYYNFEHEVAETELLTECWVFLK
jgi:AraC family transcriptional regulator